MGSAKTQKVQPVRQWESVITVGSHEIELYPRKGSIYNEQSGWGGWHHASSTPSRSSSNPCFMGSGRIYVSYTQPILPAADQLPKFRGDGALDVAWELLFQQLPGAEIDGDGRLLMPVENKSVLLVFCIETVARKRALTVRMTGHTNQARIVGKCADRLSALGLWLTDLHEVAGCPLPEDFYSNTIDLKEDV